MKQSKVTRRRCADWLLANGFRLPAELSDLQGMTAAQP
jgi:hypothetical protein